MDESALDELEGLLGTKETLETASPESFKVPVPPENLVALVKFAQGEISKGVNTPELLAKGLLCAPVENRYGKRVGIKPVRI